MQFAGQKEGDSFPLPRDAGLCDYLVPPKNREQPLSGRGSNEGEGQGRVGRGSDHPRAVIPPSQALSNCGVGGSARGSGGALLGAGRGSMLRVGGERGLLIIMTYHVCNDGAPLLAVAGETFEGLASGGGFFEQLRGRGSLACRGASP